MMRLSNSLISHLFLFLFLFLFLQIMCFTGDIFVSSSSMISPNLIILYNSVYLNLFPLWFATVYVESKYLRVSVISYFSFTFLLWWFRIYHINLNNYAQVIQGLEINNRKGNTSTKDSFDSVTIHPITKQSIYMYYTIYQQQKQCIYMFDTKHSIYCWSIHFLRSGFSLDLRNWWF